MLAPALYGACLVPLVYDLLSLDQLDKWGMMALSLLTGLLQLVKV
jgi:hypothetical protein